MSKFSFLPLASFAFALLLAGSSPAHATGSLCDATIGNLVTNCGFETGNQSGWNVTNLYTVYSGATSSNPHSGTWTEAFGNPASLGPDTIAQTFSDVAGENYTFSFYMGYSGHALTGVGFDDSDQFTASYDGTSKLALVNVTDDGGFDPSRYALYTYTVKGTGSDTIAFSGDGASAAFYLDDVSVVGNGVPVGPPPAVTPEPSSLVLLGTGLLGCAGSAYRRLKKRRA